MRTITKLVVATAMALTLVSGPTAQAEPDGRMSTSAATSKVATDDAAAAAWWHITGTWVGQRPGYGPVKMRFWRTDAGVLVGSERTSRGAVCTWRLRFIRKADGVFVFQERTTSGGCAEFRVRLRKWNGGRLKVSSHWGDMVLHRP